ncbi:MAG: MFS transporter [Methanobacterium sp.]|nr:MFS transporter [Methanobacterium sp.]
MIVDKSLQRITLFLVALAAFLIPFMGSSLSLALPVIQKEFLVNIIILGWIPTVFVLANAAFALPFGRLADIYGRRKIFTYGVAIYTIASFLAALANSGQILIFFSFIQGLGCAMIFATMVALLSSVFPLDQRGEALGLYVSAVFIGLFLGPLLGGLLIQNLGWRSIFLFNIPLGVILLVIIFWKFKMEWAESRGEHFDIRGTGLYSLSLMAILYGFTTFHDNFGILIFIIGVIGIIGFILMERNTKNPLLPFNIFKNRVSVFTALSMLLLNISISAIAIILSLYFQALKGFNPEITALILASQPLMVALISPIVGRVIDKKDYSSLPILGLILIILGLGMLIFLDMNSPLYLPILSLVMVGLGQALFSSPITRTFMGSVESKIYGVASSLFSTVIYLGQTLSLTILLIIFNIYLGQMEISPNSYLMFLDGTQILFIIYTLISGFALSFTLMVRRQR